jgi:hypothetical protein
MLTAEGQNVRKNEESEKREGEKGVETAWVH